MGILLDCHRECSDTLHYSKILVKCFDSLTTEQKQTYVNSYKDGDWNIVFSLIPEEYQSGAMSVDFAGDLEELISEEFGS